MKKFLIFTILAVISIALVLTGCSSTTTQTATSTVTNTSTATSTATATTTATQTQTSTTTATQTQTATSTIKTGGTLTMLWRGAGGNLGWSNSGPGSMGELVMTNQIFYEPLIKGGLDASGNVAYSPCLAKSWEIASDHKSVTFHLQEGVKFHDGTDFDAEAVKFNYETIMKQDGEPNWASVEVIGKYTVKVNLKQWKNPAMDEFLNTSLIVSPTAFAKGMDYLSVHPVGTGPFVFSEFELDVKCVGVKNTNYWGQGPFVDKFVMKYVPDWNARKTALQTGEADISLAERGKQTYDLRQLGFNIFSANDAVFTMFPSGGNPDSPFAKKEVREALEYAIDREALAAGIGFGELSVPYQLDPKSDPAWNPNFVGRKFDLAKAKELMKAAGYGDTAFSTSLIPMPGSSDDAAVFVQDSLKKIGITVKIEKWESAKFFQFMTGQTWEGLVITGVPCSGNYNFTLNTFFSSANTQMYISKAATTASKAAADESVNSATWNKDLIQKAVKALSDEAIGIPLYDAGMGYGWYKYLDASTIGTREHPMYWNVETFKLNK